MNTKETKPIDLFDWCMEQATRIVAGYRAEAPVDFDPVNQAYGQTDVMHDRRYLTAMLSHINPRLREQAKIALENMDREEATGEHQQALHEQIRSREDISAANRAQRELTASEGAKWREMQTAEATRAHKENEARLAQVEKDRQAIGLQNMLQSPEVRGNKQLQAQISAKLLENYGIQTGPAAPDATTAAAQRAAGALGEKVAAPQAAAPTPLAATTPQTPAAPTGQQTAAATAPAPTGAAPVTGGKTYVSPQELSPPPGASPAQHERAFELQRLVQTQPDQYTTGERPAIQYNIPGGNVPADALSDPSVRAAAGSTRTELPGGLVQLGLPSGGTATVGAPRDESAARIANAAFGVRPGELAGRPEVANRLAAAGNPPIKGEPSMDTTPTYGPGAEPTTPPGYVGGPAGGPPNLFASGGAGQIVKPEAGPAPVTSGRGEFAGNYPIEPNAPGRLLDYPAAPQFPVVTPATGAGPAQFSPSDLAKAQTPISQPSPAPVQQAQGGIDPQKQAQILAAANAEMEKRKKQQSEE
jgi:hypothetical protein